MDRTSSGAARLSRRSLLKWSGAAGALALTGTLGGCVPPQPGDPDADANGLVLHAGFTSRIIAQGGQRIPGTNHTFGAFPDGAATFADPEVAGGWYHAVNHEVPFGGGGVTAIRYAPDGQIVDAYTICTNTSLNCAGGATPWHTWLTCEEHDLGVVWECDPTRAFSHVRRPALGAFAHEAAAVAQDDRVYLTEDRSNGAFYRFTPNTPGNLSAGLLEVATGRPGEQVRWKRVPDPAAGNGPCRFQVPGTIAFDGGEGIDTDGDRVWFTTKGDNRVWEYHLDTDVVDVRFQAGGGSVLSGVDNLVADRPFGTVLVAEDGDNMEVVALHPDNSAQALVRIVGHPGSEVTGPTFSPDGQRLYFSSQRGPVGPLRTMLGVTYEVTGPFDDLLGR